jgi:hypothetical protein
MDIEREREDGNVQITMHDIKAQKHEGEKSCTVQVTMHSNLVNS